MVTKFGPQHAHRRPSPHAAPAAPLTAAGRAVPARTADRVTLAPAQSSFTQAVRSPPVQLTPTTEPPERLGVNSTQGNLRSAAGPIQPADWNDPARIASRLTQTPASGATENSARRCGPSALLGATVMQGREATARLAERLAANGSSSSGLRQIAARLRANTSSYEDLAQLQDELFARGNRQQSAEAFEGAVSAAGRRVLQGQTVDGMSHARWAFEVDMARRTPTPEAAQTLTRLLGREVRMSRSGTHYLPTEDGRVDRSGFSYDELHELARTTHSGAEQRPMDTLGERYLRLHRGESISFSVRGGPESRRDDHFVVLGRDPQGRPFLYNPDPRPGDATLTVGSAQGPQPAAFLAALSEYDQRRYADTPAVGFTAP